MKKLLLYAVILGSLSGCSEKNGNSQPRFDTANGTKFTGIWTNPNQTSAQSQNGFVIDDRILIEPKTDNRYSVSVLARGVFTEMQYEPKSGLLCTSSGGPKACFQLENEDTMTVGSETGLITYKRRK